MPRIRASSPTPGIIRSARRASLAVALSGILCLGTTSTAAPRALEAVREGAWLQIHLVEGAAAPVRAQRLRWDWRWAGDKAWSESGSEQGVQPLLRLRVPSGARALEVTASGELEEGSWRVHRLVLMPDEGTPVPRSRVVAPDPVTGARSTSVAATEVRGQLVLGDRLHDLGGYTGEWRDQLVRHVEVELRRVADDSLLATGATDAQGLFRIGADLAAGDDLRLVARSRVAGLTGLSLEVRADSSETLPLTLRVAELTGVAPGDSVDLGRVRMPDAGGAATVQAFHLLDLALSTAQMLAGPDHLGSWPGGGAMPAIYWGPAAEHATTRAGPDAVVVSSPGSGDSDGWSDGLFLACLGQWVLSTHGVSTTFEPPSFADVPRGPREALDLGASWTLAAHVRAWRARTLEDADGLPAEDGVALLVDLPTAPPPGFPTAAEAGVDLERRLTAQSDSLRALGQLGVWNVAAMGWDLVDGVGTRDGDAVDDDGIDGDGSRWFGVVTSPVAPPRSGSAFAWEDVVETWRTRHGESTALDSVVVADGRCALFDDLAEPDDLPALAPALVPWVQPPLDPTGTVVINECFLGDRDGVELFNRSDATVELGGWSIEVRRNGFGTGAVLTTILPTGLRLRPGRALRVVEGIGTGSEFEFYAPGWSVPWSADEDGACTLRDAGGVAVDFLRWAGAGGTDLSGTPIPPSLAFTGLLVAPRAEGWTLGRDAVGSDTDDASDFSAVRPTPRLPNLPPSSLRTLRPASDLDHLTVALDSTRTVEAQALGRRDDARPRWAVLDASGSVLAGSGTLELPSRGAVLGWVVDPADSLVLRLEQSPEAETAAAVGVALWVPADQRGRLPVLGLRARTLKLDPFLDTVVVSWMPQGSYEEIEVRVDGDPALSLPGDATEAELQLSAGRHRIGVRPLLGGIAGVEQETGVFVGSTPCDLRAEFEVGGATYFDLTGFQLAPESHDGLTSLHDAPLGEDYPAQDEAIAWLVAPVDLTSGSRLEFWHAAHLVPDGDRGLVELSLDDGLSWLELAAYDGDDQPGAQPGAPNWLDGVLQAEDWVFESIDLTAWAGERVRLRLRRVSNESGTSAGWWIDSLAFGTPPGTEVWVDEQGSDLFGCGHPERPLATIAAALERVSPGDQLRLGPGTFGGVVAVLRDGQWIDATLPVPPGVRVRGAGSEHTVVEVESGARGLIVSDGDGHRAELEGVTLRGGDIGLDVAADSLRVVDVVVEGATAAIVVRGGRAELSESILRDGQTGLYLEAGSVELDRSTLDLFTAGALVLAGADSFVVERSLLTRVSGPLVQVFGPAPPMRLSCSGFYGIADPFVGVPADAFLNTLVADPLYCDPNAGDLTLARGSPFLDFLECGRVGARGEGCTKVAVAGPPVSAHLPMLAPPAPNPFNPRTRLLVRLSSGQSLRLQVYDARGRLVRTLADGRFEAGEHEMLWSGRDDRGRAVSSGVYYVVLRTEDVVRSRPVALVR